MMVRIAGIGSLPYIESIMHLKYRWRYPALVTQLVRFKSGKVLQQFRFMEIVVQRQNAALWQRMSRFQNSPISPFFRKGYKMKDFTQLQPGDTVVRMLAGTIPMTLTVSEMTPDRIICGEWEFDSHTGAEIDDFLGWGAPPLMTGSFLKR